MDAGSRVSPHQASYGTAVRSAAATARSTPTGPVPVRQARCTAATARFAMAAAMRVIVDSGAVAGTPPDPGDGAVVVPAATVEAMTELDGSLYGFTGTVLRPGDDGFDEARRVWNGVIDQRPALVARCRSTADVAAAVRFGVRHDLAIAVRGGGHSIPGHSTCEGGLVVDLSRMKAIAVDPGAQRATVEPGVVWRELDAATQQHGLALPGGEVSDTGVAGLTLGGGIGWLSRAFGWPATASSPPNWSRRTAPSSRSAGSATRSCCGACVAAAGTSAW